MIKRFSFVRRAAALSPEAFHPAWIARHTQVLAADPALRSHLLHWELLHRLDEDYARSREATALLERMADRGWEVARPGDPPRSLVAAQYNRDDAAAARPIR